MDPKNAWEPPVVTRWTNKSPKTPKRREKPPTDPKTVTETTPKKRP